MKQTAVVILNWNGRQHLEQFLPSVVEHTPQQVRIVVADNGSTDDSVEFLEQHYPAIDIIRLDKNYGFAEGYNRALEQVDAEFFILLNSDVEVTAGWVEPLIATLTNHRTVAAVAPKLRSYGHREYFEYAGAAGGYIDILGYILNFAVNIFGTRDYWKEIFWPEVPTWLKVPIPIMPAIEFIGLFTKPFSLMIRLFANILAGHAIILILTCIVFATAELGAAVNGAMSAVSVVLSIFMNCLELLVAFLQAFVFTMLSAVGLLLPFSHRETACAVTPIASAASLRVRPASLLALL